jgi:hypothetical protein
MPLDGSVLSLEGQLVGHDSGNVIAADDCGLTTTSEKAITEYDLCKSKKTVVVDKLTPPSSTLKRCDSWSSTRAVLRGNFGTVKINPSTGRNSQVKASFFNTEAFEEDDDDDSLKSFESGVATGTASSECSFNNNNDDDEVRSDTSICEIFNPMEMATSSSLSVLDEETVGSSYSMEVPMEVVMSLSSDMCVPSSQKGIHRDDATVAAAVTAPMKVVDVTVAPAPPHQYQPQTAALPTTAQLHQPYHTAPKMTRIQAPIRQSRPPLLPADPTTKYRKIMKTYGFAAIHHVCFATLYQEHQRYVAALAKADPTLAPSPFPFNKELSAQQRAV